MAIVVRPWIKVVQGFLNLALRLGIDRRRGFVENQNPRVDQQRPGDRNSLPLAARERLAALAHQRVVAVGQSQDELMRPCGAGGGDDLVARARRAGRRRCSRRSCRKTRTGLAARCRCCGDTPHWERADVVAIDENRALVPRRKSGR